MRTRAMTPLTTKPVPGTLADPHPADASPDGVVKYTGAGNDRDPILQFIGGSNPTTTATGYANADVNMDGVIKYVGSGNDRDPILVTVGSTTPNAVRIEQVP